MLMADLRRDYVQTLFARLNTLSMEQLEAQFQQLEAEGRGALLASGIASDRIVFERAADMRYVGQEHAVTVRLPAHVTDVAARQEIKRLFDEAHAQLYNHSAPEESADVVSVRVSAIGWLSKPPLPEIAAGARTPPETARRGTRAVVFDGPGALPAYVFDRGQLLQGNVIVGPAIIEEAASVTVVGPEDTVEVNAFGHLVMRLGVTP
jgi:N-methylhydantoinase A